MARQTRQAAAAAVLCILALLVAGGAQPEVSGGVSPGVCASLAAGGSNGSCQAEPVTPPPTCAAAASVPVPTGMTGEAVAGTWIVRFAAYKSAEEHRYERSATQDHHH